MNKIFLAFSSLVREPSRRLLKRVCSISAFKDGDRHDASSGFPGVMGLATYFLFFLLIGPGCETGVRVICFLLSGLDMSSLSEVDISSLNERGRGKGWFP